MKRVLFVGFNELTHDTFRISFKKAGNVAVFVDDVKDIPKVKHDAIVTNEKTSAEAMRPYGKSCYWAVLSEDHSTTFWEQCDRYGANNFVTAPTSFLIFTRNLLSKLNSKHEQTLPLTQIQQKIYNVLKIHKSGIRREDVIRKVWGDTENKSLEKDLKKLSVYITNMNKILADYRLHIDRLQAGKVLRLEDL